MPWLASSTLDSSGTSETSSSESDEGDVPAKFDAQFAEALLKIKTKDPAIYREDAELFSYNWGAPFRLGFNTLHVNGKTCICLASSHMSLTKLRRARDKADEVLSALMD